MKIGEVSTENALQNDLLLRCCIVRCIDRGRVSSILLCVDVSLMDRSCSPLDMGALDTTRNTFWRGPSGRLKLRDDFGEVYVVMEGGADGFVPGVVGTVKFSALLERSFGVAEVDVVSSDRIGKRSIGVWTLVFCASDTVRLDSGRRSRGMGSSPTHGPAEVLSFRRENGQRWEGAENCTYDAVVVFLTRVQQVVEGKWGSEFGMAGKILAVAKEGSDWMSLSNPKSTLISCSQ